MTACDPKYLHSPPEPDFTFWPFDVPSIMVRLARMGLEVNTVGHLDGMQAQIDDLIIRLQAAVQRANELENVL